MRRRPAAAQAAPSTVRTFAGPAGGRGWPRAPRRAWRARPPPAPCARPPSRPPWRASWPWDAQIQTTYAPPLSIRTWTLRSLSQRTPRPSGAPLRVGEQLFLPLGLLPGALALALALFAAALGRALPALGTHHGLLLWQLLHMPRAKSPVKPGAVCVSRLFDPRRRLVGWPTAAAAASSSDADGALSLSSLSSLSPLVSVSSSAVRTPLAPGRPASIDASSCRSCSVCRPRRPTPRGPLPHVRVGARLSRQRASTAPHLGPLGRLGRVGQPLLAADLGFQPLLLLRGELLDEALATAAPPAGRTHQIALANAERGRGRRRASGLPGGPRRRGGTTAPRPARARRAQRPAAPCRRSAAAWASRAPWGCRSRAR